MEVAENSGFCIRSAFGGFGLCSVKAKNRDHAFCGAGVSPASSSRDGGATINFNPNSFLRRSTGLFETGSNFLGTFRIGKSPTVGPRFVSGGTDCLWRSGAALKQSAAAKQTLGLGAFSEPSPLGTSRVA